MKEELISGFSSHPESHNSICSDITTKGNQNTNCIVSSSSNFSSFNLHIKACSSPYAKSLNGSSGQTSDALYYQHNGSNHQLSGKLHTKHSEANTLRNLILLLNKRLIVHLVSFLRIPLLYILYKMVIISMDYANQESFIGIKTFAEACYYDAIAWAQEHNFSGIIHPLFCGLVIAIFGYTLVYLDSNIPGISPPTPFSPRRKVYHYQKRSSVHLGYITAIAVGIIVAIIKYLNI